jgi:large subunit ribosomal protein L35Ae
MVEKKTSKKAAPKKDAEHVSDVAFEAKSGRNAVILSYRGGKKTRRLNQLLIEVDGADTKEKASSFIGMSVAWKTPSGRFIQGKITHAHGQNGVLRVRFSKGLPGEALGKKARVV